MTMATNAVLRLEQLAGLPDDPEARALAVRRASSRTTLGLVGGLIGALAGVQPMLSLGFFDGGYIVLFLLATLGIQLGTWWGHFASFRRPAGPAEIRVAQLLRRQLRDYLTRGELVGQAWASLSAAYVVLVGLVAVRGVGGDRRIGWGLVLCGGVALATCLLAPVLQRRVLQTSQPALSESALRWDLAERAQVLREVMIGVVTTGFVMNGVFLVSQLGELSTRFPDVLHWISIPVVIGSWVFGFWAIFQQRKMKTWQRLREQA